jgi:hypothetical protein
MVIVDAHVNSNTEKYENDFIYVTLSVAKGLVLPQGEILHFVQNDLYINHICKATLAAS